MGGIPTEIRIAIRLIMILLSVPFFIIGALSMVIAEALSGDRRIGGYWESDKMGTVEWLKR